MVNLLASQPVTGLAKPKKRIEQAPTEISPEFIEARNFAEKWEGGYANHPSDPGGPTKYGISQRAYPKLNIKSLSRNQAREIYKKEYWDRIKGDELPSDVSRVLFDVALNSGVNIASKHLQLAIGARPDGIIGPRTLKKLNTYLQDKDSHSLAMSLLEKRRWFYNKIIKRNPKLEAFRDQWMSRTRSLQEELELAEVMRRQEASNDIAKKAFQ